MTAKAIENYQRAIVLNPAYVEAHYNLGLSYEDASEYENAISEYLQSPDQVHQQVARAIADKILVNVRETPTASATNVRRR